MIRLGALRLLGLALLAVGLAGAAGTAAEAYGHQGLSVDAEGATFDQWHISVDASLEYTVRPLDSQGSTYFRRTLDTKERYAGWAAFEEAPQTFPDGYCVTWVRLDRYEWGEWMDGPACTTAPAEPGQPAGDPTEDPTAASTPDAGQTSTPTATPATPAPAKPEPAPSPSATEPTPDPVSYTHLR
ncbi:hypothetical protein HGK34_21615, partial [Myceligenerans sp. I2]|nr:hypothetical protein [Myceligenerans indicum]